MYINGEGSSILVYLRGSFCYRKVDAAHLKHADVLSFGKLEETKQEKFRFQFWLGRGRKTTTTAKKLQ